MNYPLLEEHLNLFFDWLQVDGHKGLSQRFALSLKSDERRHYATVLPRCASDADGVWRVKACWFDGLLPQQHVAGRLPRRLPRLVSLRLLRRQGVLHA